MKNYYLDRAKSKETKENFSPWIYGYKVPKKYNYMLSYNPSFVEKVKRFFGGK